MANAVSVDACPLKVDACAISLTPPAARPPPAGLLGVNACSIFLLSSLLLSRGGHELIISTSSGPSIVFCSPGPRLEETVHCCHASPEKLGAADATVSRPSPREEASGSDIRPSPATVLSWSLSSASWCEPGGFDTNGERLERGCNSVHDCPGTLKSRSTGTYRTSIAILLSVEASGRLGLACVVPTPSPVAGDVVPSRSQALRSD